MIEKILENIGTPFTVDPTMFVQKAVHFREHTTWRSIPGPQVIKVREITINLD